MWEEFDIDCYDDAAWERDDDYNVFEENCLDQDRWLEEQEYDDDSYDETALHYDDAEYLYQDEYPQPFEGNHYE